MIIPPLTPVQKDQLQRAFGGYSIMAIGGVIACYYCFPEELRWVAYIPMVLLVLAAIATWMFILSRGDIIKQIDCVYINHKRVSACQFCPMAEIKTNIINSKFPIVKCRETAKVCYTPTTIPRWCPYAE